MSPKTPCGVLDHQFRVNRLVLEIGMPAYRDLGFELAVHVDVAKPRHRLELIGPLLGPPSLFLIGLDG